MGLTAEQFAKALIAAGLFSADEVKVFWSSLPADQVPADGKAFAKLLNDQKRLTKFQAGEILSGSKSPLVLGDYVLLDKIGAGGMGQVFKAQHRHMERLAAIKLLPTSLTKDEAAVKRFQREVKAAAKLSHPQIVQTYDAGVQRGVWYLVMEYVDGRDLSATVTGMGRLPIAQAISFIRQAAKGLAYAHGKGVVHRDIKPANLLLDQEGTIKILDMGLARFDDAAAKDGLTETGQVMGTVDYMAPEQAFDVHTADARADIYSLGCTLYRLLTGRSMYEAESLVKKLMAHQHQPTPPLATHRPDTPQPLIAIFERMVAKKPADRYQTMAEVEAALAGFENPTAATSTAKAEPDSKLSSFLQSFTGKKPSPTATANAPAVPAAKPAIEVAPTISRVHAQIDTDPISNRSIQFARENSDNVDAPTPPLRPAKPWLLIVGGSAAVLLIALGIWSWFANQPTKIDIPPGGSATVVNNNPALPIDTSRFKKTNDFALEFDGLDDYVELPTIEVGPALTVEAWVCPFDASLRTFIVGNAEVAGWGVNSQGSNSGWATAIHGNSKGWAAAIHGNSKYHNATSPSPPVSNARVHLASVFDGHQIRLYIDGKVQPIAESVELPLRSSSVPVFIGANPPDKSEPFYGRIDELRISSSMRYTKDFEPKVRFDSDDQTLALYHFDEAQGKKLVDSSSHARHGKINGAPRWVPGLTSPQGFEPQIAKAGPLPPFVGESIYTFPGTDLEFLRDGRRLRVGRYLYELQSGSVLKNLVPIAETREVAAGVAVSADEQRTAWITKDGELTICEAGAVIAQEKLQLADPWKYSVRITADGHRVATAAGNEVQVWDVAPFKLVDSFQAKSEVRTEAFRFSPSERWLSTGAYNYWSLWDARNKKTASFSIENWAQSIVFSPDESAVLVARELKDREHPTEYCWYDLTTSKPLATVVVDGSRAIAILDNRKSVVFAKRNSVHVAQSGQPPSGKVLATAVGFWTELMLSRDVQYLALTDYNFPPKTTVYRLLSISTADRAAAEALLPYAELTLVAAGQRLVVLANGKLPDEPFALTDVRIWRPLPKGFTEQTLLPALRPLASLKSISDSRNQIGASGGDPLVLLQQLSRCQSAKTLVNVGLHLYPEQQSIAALQKFKDLRVTRFVIGDEDGVARMDGLSKSVDHVHFFFSGNNFTEAGASKLASLHLRELSFEHLSNVTRSNFEALAESKSLHTLNILSMRFDDEQIANLAVLATCGTLRKIHFNLTNEGITEEALQQLSAKLPRCRLEWGARVFLPKIEKQSPAVGETVDLLPLIDPAIHSRTGIWEVKDGALLSPTESFRSLELPIQPARAYRIEASAERMTGGEDLHFAVMVGAAETRIAFEAYGLSKISGLVLVEGKDLTQQVGPYREPIFTPGKQTKIVIEVTPSNVLATCDGKSIVDWHGDSKTLGDFEYMRQFYSPNAIAICTGQSRFRITKLTYTALPTP